MACQQRYLKQFNSTAEQQSHRQEPGQSEAIADSKHPGDKPKGCKMLKDLPDAGDGALVGRDNRQHNNCGDAETRQRAHNSSILVDRPFHNSVAVPVTGLLRRDMVGVTSSLPILNYGVGFFDYHHARSFPDFGPCERMGGAHFSVPASPPAWRLILNL
jgi:hypothetical protein